MIILDKTKSYYLEDLTIKQLQEIADAVIVDKESRELWTKGNKNPVSTLRSCFYTKRLLTYSNAGGYNTWLYHPKGPKVDAGDYTNAKVLFGVRDIEFKNKRICII